MPAFRDTEFPKFPSNSEKTFEQEEIVVERVYFFSPHVASSLKGKKIRAAFLFFRRRNEKCGVGPGRRGVS